MHFAINDVIMADLLGFFPLPDAYFAKHRAPRRHGIDLHQTA
jgi:hypothetical protein